MRFRSLRSGAGEDGWRHLGEWAQTVRCPPSSLGRVTGVNFLEAGTGAAVRSLAGRLASDRPVYVDCKWRSFLVMVSRL